MTPKEVLATIREREVKPLTCASTTSRVGGSTSRFRPTALDEAVFEDGIGFDGASVPGWKAINESDMLLLPESNTAFVDPFCRDTTLTLICNIQEPLTKEDYSRDPRNIARKAVNHMRATGTADTALLAPRWSFSSSTMCVSIRPRIPPFTRWIRPKVHGTPDNRNRPTSVTKSVLREGYSPTPPADALNDLRTEMMLAMRGCGLHADAQAHGVATGGQGQIALRDDELVRSADAVMKFKYWSKTRPPARQGGQVHAQAAFRRQRLRSARPGIAMVRRPQSVRRGRLRRLVRIAL